MKQLLDLVPIALFFIVYQFDGRQLQFGDWQYTLDGIYSATAVLIAATSVQLALTWLLTRTVDTMLWVVFAAAWIFGGLTLLLHDDAFIMWKPTIFNWGLATAFLGAFFIGRINLLEKLLGSQLQLPSSVWARLMWLWVGNFLVVGSLNLVVAYGFSQDTWVSYKLYSSIGFTLLLSVLTVVIIAPHLPDDHTPGKS